MEQDNLRAFELDKERKTQEFWRIKLTEIEAAKIDTKVVGSGGMQDLLRELQYCYNPKKRTLLLSDEMVNKVRKYYYSYGKRGGMQDRLRPIILYINNATDPAVTKLDDWGFNNK